MALQKTFNLAEGYSANYLRLDRIESFSRTDKKVVLFFSLYKDAAIASTDGAAPIKPNWCRLRLERDKFDQYFANSVLNDANFIAQAYVAAKVEPVDCYIGSGVQILSDAVDV